MIRTLPLLAGCYKGHMQSFEVTLTHALEDGAEYSRCRRIPAENFADEHAATPEEQALEPTCKACARRYSRIAWTLV